MIKSLDICPPRFRNREDALQFLECVRTHTPFPPEKWVYPFEEKDFGPPTGKKLVRRQEYEDAPFEARYIYSND